SFSNYEVILTEAVTALNATPVAETTDLTREDNQLTIATYNVLNLDPSDDTFAALAAHIVTNLGAPDIVALQVEADSTFQALIAAITNVGGPLYSVSQIDPEDGQDGGQPGGNIRVGFLFNSARVSTEEEGQMQEREVGDAVTPVSVTNNNGAPMLSVNPGRINPDAFPDSRQPLAAEFQFNGQTVFAIANHFNSKSGDDPLFGRVQPPMLNTQPERITQAEAVNEFVDEILALDADANVIVLGDLNDFEFSLPLDRLAGNVLTNTINAVAERDRYTFIFQGNSQVLDHILVSNNLAPGAIADIVHVNVDTAATVSDREPVVARIAIPGS
ncbi:MAG: endonuclease/exonuclease/phosphatase family protein, partial [Cyanobacteria bacterium P01_F01_bin.33]